MNKHNDIATICDNFALDLVRRIRNQDRKLTVEDIEVLYNVLDTLRQSLEILDKKVCPKCGKHSCGHRRIDELADELLHLLENRQETEGEDNTLEGEDGGPLVTLERFLRSKWRGQDPQTTDDRRAEARPALEKMQ